MLNKPYYGMNKVKTFLKRENVLEKLMRIKLADV